MYLSITLFLRAFETHSILKFAIFYGRDQSYDVVHLTLVFSHVEY